MGAGHLLTPALHPCASHAPRPRWQAANRPPPKRFDSDGALYTRDEFLKEYGSDEKWEMAPASKHIDCDFELLSIYELLGHVRACSSSGRPARYFVRGEFRENNDENLDEDDDVDITNPYVALRTLWVDEQEFFQADSFMQGPEAPYHMPVEQLQDSLMVLLQNFAHGMTSDALEFARARGLGGTRHVSTLAAVESAREAARELAREAAFGLDAAEHTPALYARWWESTLGSDGHSESDAGPISAQRNALNAAAELASERAAAAARGSAAPAAAAAAPAEQARRSSAASPSRPPAPQGTPGRDSPAYRTSPAGRSSASRAWRSSRHHSGR